MFLVTRTAFTPSPQEFRLESYLVDDSGRTPKNGVVDDHLDSISILSEVVDGVGQHRASVGIAAIALNKLCLVEVMPQNWLNEQHLMATRCEDSGAGLKVPVLSS